MHNEPDFLSFKGKAIVVIGLLIILAVPVTLLLKIIYEIY